MGLEAASGKETQGKEDAAQWEPHYPPFWLCAAGTPSMCLGFCDVLKVTCRGLAGLQRSWGEGLASWGFGKVVPGASSHPGDKLRSGRTI